MIGSFEVFRRAPGVAAGAVDRGLQVDPPHPLEHADKEGVDRDQGTGVRRLDVPLAELRREAFQQPDLLVAELDLLLGRRLLQAQQALVLGQQPVALPDAAHAASGDLQAAQTQLLLDPQRTVAGVLQGMCQHRRLDLGRDPVRVRTARAGQAVEQAGGTVGSEVAADLVELLARAAPHPARPADVVQLLGKLQQRQLAPCYLLLRGHRVLPGRMVFGDSILNPGKRGGHARGARPTLAVARPAGDPNCQVITRSAQSDVPLSANHAFAQIRPGGERERPRTHLCACTTTEGCGWPHRPGGSQAGYSKGSEPATPVAAEPGAQEKDLARTVLYWTTTNIPRAVGFEPS